LLSGAPQRISPANRKPVSVRTIGCLAWFVLALVGPWGIAGDNWMPKSDSCRVELYLPEGTTLAVDGRDCGQLRELDFSGLSPGQYYVSQLQVRFPGGDVQQRTLMIEGGRRLRLAASEPRANRPELLVQTSRHWDSLDGRLLATGSDKGKVQLWDASAGTELRSWRAASGHGGGPVPLDSVDAVAFRPDGRQILAACTESHRQSKPDGTDDYKFDYYVRCYDLAGKSLHEYPCDKPVEYLANLPDGRRMLFEDNLWDVQSGKKIRKLTGQSQTPKAAFAGDGRHALVGTSLWDLSQGKQVRCFPGDRAAISPDARYVATAAGRPDARPELCLWDAATGRKLADLEGHAKMITGLAFSPDSRRLLSGEVNPRAPLRGLPGNAPSASPTQAASGCAVGR